MGSGDQRGWVREDRIAPTEGAGDDFVSVGVVEGDGVHDIPVTLQGEQLVSGDCVPDLASPVVGACDEL